MQIDTGDTLTCGVEIENGHRLVRIGGELKMPVVEAMRSVFLEAMQAGESATVNATALVETDLSGLQLLCSAHRSFRARGLHFRLEDFPDRLRVAARAAGFDHRCSTCRYRDETCLWMA